MSSAEVRPSRRAQRRVETVAEIKARAMQQIADDGVEGLSLSAVARAMAMVPAALYRYFDSKDDLLAELVADAYDSLAAHLEQAAAATGQPRDRLVAVARAYRGWALSHPNAYRLLFHNSSGSGQDLAPDRTLIAAQRSMDVFLRSVAPLRPAAGLPLDHTLAAQISHWGQRAAEPDLSAQTLSVGLACWTRLHGLISLELGRHLIATGIDPGRLYDAEINALLDLTDDSTTSNSASR